MTLIVEVTTLTFWCTCRRVRNPSMEERLQVISTQLWSYNGPYEAQCIEISPQIRQILVDFELKHTRNQNQSTNA